MIEASADTGALLARIDAHARTLAATVEQERRAALSRGEHRWRSARSLWPLFAKD